MSHHNIRIQFLALTPQRKAQFFRWALEGFRFPKLPLARPIVKFSARAA